MNIKSYIIGRADKILYQKMKDCNKYFFYGIYGSMCIIKANILQTMFDISTCPVPDSQKPQPDHDIAVYLVPGDNKDWIITWLVI